MISLGRFCTISLRDFSRIVELNKSLFWGLQTIKNNNQINMGLRIVRKIKRRINYGK